VERPERRIERNAHDPAAVAALKEAVALANRLRRASPKTGEHLSYRKISAQLAEAGHMNERGQPFNPKSIKAMLEG
jgi:hypothetical protein